MWTLVKFAAGPKPMPFQNRRGGGGMGVRWVLEMSGCAPSLLWGSRAGFGFGQMAGMRGFSTLPKRVPSAKHLQILMLRLAGEHEQDIDLFITCETEEEGKDLLRRTGHRCF